MGGDGFGGQNWRLGLLVGLFCHKIYCFLLSRICIVSPINIINHIDIFLFHDKIGLFCHNISIFINYISLFHNDT